jgi:hypothetical protein
MECAHERLAKECMKGAGLMKSAGPLVGEIRGHNDIGDKRKASDCARARGKKIRLKS